jgi:hypothetical protein
MITRDNSQCRDARQKRVKRSEGACNSQATQGEPVSEW